MSRSRRYLLSAAVFAACVGLALGVLTILPSRPGVTKANFDRIVLGMTMNDVMGILGDRIVGNEIPMPDEISIGPIIWWAAPDGTEIAIQFENDNVRGMRFHETTESIHAKFRRWLHLPKDPLQPQ